MDIHWNIRLTACQLQLGVVLILIVVMVNVMVMKLQSLVQKIVAVMTAKKPGMAMPAVWM